MPKETREEIERDAGGGRGGPRMIGGAGNFELREVRGERERERGREGEGVEAGGGRWRAEEARILLPTFC